MNQKHLLLTTHKATLDIASPNPLTTDQIVDAMLKTSFAQRYKLGGQNVRVLPTGTDLIYGISVNQNSGKAIEFTKVDIVRTEAELTRSLGQIVVFVTTGYNKLSRVPEFTIGFHVTRD